MPLTSFGVYVCLHACVYTLVSAHTCACMHVHLRASVYVGVGVGLEVSIDVSECRCTWRISVSLHTCINPFYFKFSNKKLRHIIPSSFFCYTTHAAQIHHLPFIKYQEINKSFIKDLIKTHVLIMHFLIRNVLPGCS